MFKRNKPESPLVISPFEGEQVHVFLKPSGTKNEADGRIVEREYAGPLPHSRYHSITENLTVRLSGANMLLPSGKPITEIVVTFK